jgi:hypothetical protein
MQPPLPAGFSGARRYASRRTLCPKPCSTGNASSRIRAGPAGEFSAAGGEIAHPAFVSSCGSPPVASKGLPDGNRLIGPFLASDARQSRVASHCPFHRAVGRGWARRLAAVQNLVSAKHGRRERVPPRDFVHDAQCGRQRNLQQRGARRRCSPQRRRPARRLISGRESGESSPPLSARPVDDRRPPPPRALA